MKKLIVLVILLFFGFGVTIFNFFKPIKMNSKASEVATSKKKEGKGVVSDRNKKTNKKNTSAVAKKIVLLDSLEVTDAIHLYAKGKFHRALKLFKKEKTPKERSLAYMAKSYEYLNLNREADKTWNILLKTYPNSRYCGDAYYYLATMKKKEDLLSSARALLCKAAKYSDKSTGGLKSALLMAKYYLNKGKKLEAWRYYSLVMHAPITDTMRKKIQSILTPIVQDLLLKNKATGCFIYKVEQGDSLSKIARKLKTSVELIRYLNNKPQGNDTIYPLDSLKIIPGKVNIRVSKKQFFLVLFLDNGLYFKSYSVGLGKNDKTPLGSFQVRTKQKNPDWYTKKNGKKIRIPFGDARNPLGTRWMGFSYRGLGIHGTKNPDSIGKNMSHGCIRMHNKDVEDLYRLVSRGTKVTITP